MLKYYSSLLPRLYFFSHFLFFFFDYDLVTIFNDSMVTTMDLLVRNIIGVTLSACGCCCCCFAKRIIWLYVEFWRGMGMGLEFWILLSFSPGFPALVRSQEKCRVVISVSLCLLAWFDWTGRAIDCFVTGTASWPLFLALTSSAFVGCSSSFLILQAMCCHTVLLSSTIACFGPCCVGTGSVLFKPDA